MDKRAWVHQLKAQVEKQGADAASWYVSWTDPAGKQCRKSCGPGKVGKSAANRLADKTHSELVTGTYQAKEKRRWEDFRRDYETKIAARFVEPSRMAVRMALNSFERVAKPKVLTAITASVIQQFITDRLEGKNSKHGKPSAATVNKELRYVKLVLKVAQEWGLIQAVPKIRFLKLSQKMPTFVSPEHFAAIYAACESARRPIDVPNVSPTDWWRGLLVTAYMSGWRIGQLLSLKWQDVDLDRGTALTQAEATGNKGRRDERIPIHPLVVEHLRKLTGSFGELVFPWSKIRATLWTEFREIQAAAKIADNKPMPKAGKNGRWYGFHDLRRGFATMNAGSMDLFELQGLMQHKSLETTRLYVNMAQRYTETVQRLFVPPNLRINGVG